ncbi:tetratricopeptide repeat protein [bacterium]|nr:tetratricopeptide repeat protein [bacterium]
MKYFKNIAYIAIICVAVLPNVAIGQEHDEVRQFQYAEKLSKDELYDLAAIQYAEFVRIFPKSAKTAEARYKQAESLYFSGKYAAARDAFMALIIFHAESPYAAEAQFKIAETLEKEGRFIPAAKSFYRIFVYYPDHKRAAEALLYAAINRENAKNFSWAEPLYRQIVLSYGGTIESAEAVFALAAGLAERGERQEAIALYQQLIDHPIREGDTALALKDLAPLAILEGQWTKAEDAYNRLIETSQRSELQQYGYIGKARIATSLDKIDEARVSLKKAIIAEDIQSLYAQADLGRLEAGEMNSQAAVTAYKNVLEFSCYSDAAERILEATSYLIHEKEFSNVGEICRKIYSDTTLAKNLAAKNLLTLVFLERQKGNYRDAVIHCDSFLENYPDHMLSVHLALGRAQILIHNLDAMEAGLAGLRLLMQDHPLHHLQDEVHYNYAKGALKAGLNGDALRSLEWIITHKPWSRFAVDTQQLLSRISSGHQPDWLKVMDILTESHSGEDAAFRSRAIGIDLLEQGHAVASRHFLEKAISLSPDAIWADSARYAIAEAQFAIDPASASTAFGCAANDITDKLLKNKAFARLALLDTTVTVQQLTGIIQSVNDDNIIDPLRLKMAEMYYLSEDFILVDSLFALLENSSDLEVRESVVFLNYQHHVHINNPAITDSLLSIYLERFPSGRHWPQMKYIALKTDGNPEEWQSFINMCSQTVWSDSARLELGNYLNRQGNYHEAETVFKTALLLEISKQTAYEVGLIHDRPQLAPAFKRGLAESYLGQKKSGQARLLLEEAMFGAIDPAMKKWGWSVLAALSEQVDEVDRAAWYLSQSAEHFPSDLSFNKLAELYFKYQRFAEARDIYNRMVKEKIGNQAYVASEIITCLLREGKISQSTTYFTQFKQIHKKDKQYKYYEGLYHLEKGKALAAAKRFDAAEQSLKSAIKSKQQAILPEAEVELGRTYLIMAHIDEALEILTAIPDKYPDNPAITKAYFYMAQHYENSKQFPNAVYAYRNVIDKDIDPITHKLTLRKLIECNEKIGQVDAAMAATRRFIREYPYDSAKLDMEIRIGSQYKSLAEYTRAIEIFKRLRPVADPDNEAYIQYNIGECYAAMGLWEEAAFELLKVSYLSKDTKFPWKTTALYRAGTAYLKLNQPDQARLLFQKVVRKDGAEGQFGRFARMRIAEIDAGTAE